MVRDKSSDLPNRLHNLLDSTAAEAGPSFSGIGVLVTGKMASLPLFPLRPDADVRLDGNPAHILGQISVSGSVLHDGFHILGPDLDILALSQYFSPPIVPSVRIDRSRLFGGRYLAALFGSTLAGVAAAGVATPSLGIITFVDGVETSSGTFR